MCKNDLKPIVKIISGPKGAHILNADRNSQIDS